MNALNIPHFSALSVGINEFFETFLAFLPIIFIVPSKVTTHVGVFNETRA
ncbi:MAG: hypothetical protein ACJAVO_001290 [Parvibaculaceae bacterium]|jgi:hypothetical protein